MQGITSCAIAAVAALILPTYPAANQGELSREKVAQLGKAATALVEVTVPKGKAYGSAFCIHPSGLFITNAHVVDLAGVTSVLVVIDPALSTQRIAKAKVIRVDKENDLAILQADGLKDIPTLTLGSVDQLVETTEVIAFGFPFGALLSANSQDPPAVSVNIGAVTSLRMKNKVLNRIQVDNVLNPGNSGGPLLNRQGKVLGVVVAGIKGTQVNLAIPSTIVSTFIGRPELEFKLPSIARTAQSQPVVFEAKAISLVPSKKPLQLELWLKTDGSSERKFPMDLKDGVFRATAVPVPLSDKAIPLRVTIAYANGSVTGTLPDRTIKLGDKEYKLSDLRAIEFTPKSAIQLIDGKVIGEPIHGLDALEVTLGKNTVRLSVADALGIRFETTSPAVTVTCTIVVKQENVEVARKTEKLTITAPQATVSGPAIDSTAKRKDSAVLPPIKAPVLDQDQVYRPLSGAVADLTVGGAGRFLIMRLAGKQRLAVFDVELAKVVKEIPMAEENVHLAAGAHRLVIILPAAKVIQIWDLETMKRERSTPLPANLSKDQIHQICMGSASPGPLFIYLPSEKRTLTLDLDTLKTTEVSWKHWNPGGAYGPLEMRAAADGSMLFGWGGGWNGSEVAFFVKGKQQGSNDKVGGAPGLPSTDGRFILLSGRIVNRAMSASAVPELEGAYLVPASEAGYFVALPKIFGAREQTQLAGGEFAIYNDDRKQLFKVKSLDELKIASGLRWEKRIHYYPRVGLLVTVDPEKDRLVLRRIGLLDELEKLGANYLLVLSTPPAAKQGGLFTYQLDVRSKQGGVKVELVSGPEGLKVSGSGQVSWTVPADLEASEFDVLVTISDASGQEAVHTFPLKVLAQ